MSKPITIKFQKYQSYGTIFESSSITSDHFVSIFFSFCKRKVLLMLNLIHKIWNLFLLVEFVPSPLPPRYRYNVTMIDSSIPLPIVTHRYIPLLQCYPSFLIVFSPFSTDSNNYFFHLNFLATRNQKNK